MVGYVDQLVEHALGPAVGRQLAAARLRRDHTAEERRGDGGNKPRRSPGS
jgi:hypothetical protein